MVAIVKDKMEQSQTNVYISYVANRILPVIQQKDKRRAELARILLDDKQKEKIIPGYKAINIVKEERKTERKSYDKFLERMHDRMREIEVHDRLLATVIGKAIHFEKDPIIKRAFLILTKYSEDRVYQHFSRFYDAYNTRIKSSRNTYLARWAIVLIDNFLRNYRVKTSKIEVIKEKVQRINGLYGLDMSYIIKEVKSVLDSIEETMGGKIEKIADEKPKISIKPIQHLENYPEEIEYLTNIYNKIVRGESEGRWEEFEEVRKTAGTVIADKLDEYGDVYSSYRFKMWGIKGKEYLGDYPPEWIKKVGKLIKSLKGNWHGIFKEALKSFYQLYSKCELILQNRFEVNFNKIKEKANTLLGEERKEPKKTAKEIINFVLKREKAFDKEITRRRKIYIKNKNKAFPDVKAFSDVINRFFVGLKLEDFIGDVNRLRKDNLRMTGPLVATSRRFTNKYLIYDFAVDAKLLGFVSGIRANDRGMLDSALGVRRSALMNYREVIEKRDPAIKALNSLIVDLSNLIENKEVLRNQRF